MNNQQNEWSGDTQTPYPQDLTKQASEAQHKYYFHKTTNSLNETTWQGSFKCDGIIYLIDHNENPIIRKQTESEIAQLYAKHGSE